MFGESVFSHTEMFAALAVNVYGDANMLETKDAPLLR